MESDKEAEAREERAQLSRRWRPALMSFFLRRVRNHAEAEDLTQEVFVRLLAIEHMAKAPDAYVFRMAANLLRDRARRAKVRSDYQEAALNTAGDDLEPLDPYRIAASRDAMARFLAALEELPERTRTVFTLYRIENMSLRAIAESFGMSESMAKKHIVKATARLMLLMRNSQ